MSFERFWWRVLSYTSILENLKAKNAGNNLLEIDKTMTSTVSASPSLLACPVDGCFLPRGVYPTTRRVPRNLPHEGLQVRLALWSCDRRRRGVRVRTVYPISRLRLDRDRFVDYAAEHRQYRCCSVTI